jgi:aryl-phospho-beta-D-glucosidase BglC (GH1 family)
MKTKFSLFILSLLVITNLHANKFVYADGDKLKDSTGKVIRLNGVNLGGWLMWEGWIWGGGFTKETKIRENLELVAGKQAADSFRLNIYKNFITEADIKSISEMGLNVVRIPVNADALQMSFESFGGKIYGWEILDNVIAWCKKYHVYAIIDMHGAPGGQSSYFIADPDKPNLWKDPNKRIQTINLWQQIATRYANETIIAGYDLLNEPVPVPKDSLVTLYERIIAAIRKVDQNHLLILEGANFARDFSMFEKLPDKNMMFSFHVYTWLGGEPEDKMEKFAELSQKFDVPVWCGEWGENNYDVVEKTLKSLNDTTNNFSGWCFWTWKKTPNTYPALNSINTTTSWKTLIKWCSTGTLKNSPGHDVAIEAMKEFQEAVLFEKLTVDNRLKKLLKDYAVQ